MRLIEDRIASKFLEESPEGKANIFIDLDDAGEVEVTLIPITSSTSKDEDEENDISFDKDLVKA
jgi:hypothetical protein